MKHCARPCLHFLSPPSESDVGVCGCRVGRRGGAPLAPTPALGCPRGLTRTALPEIPLVGLDLRSQRMLQPQTLVHPVIVHWKIKLEGRYVFNSLFYSTRQDKTRNFSKVISFSNSRY